MSPEEAVERDDDYRRSKRNRTANRQYQDYELHVTVEEQEDRPDYEEDDPERMTAKLTVRTYMVSLRQAS